MNITQERVRDLLEYRNGRLYWKQKTARKGNLIIGKEAGGETHRGYRRIQINSKYYYCHRLIYLYHFGYMPKLIDHINQDTKDNRIENLRDVPMRCNLVNSKVYSTNTSGVRGVSWNKKTKKWCVSIKNNNENFFIGEFGDFDDAVLARLAQEEMFQWDECNEETSAFKYAKENRLI